MIVLELPLLFITAGAEVTGIIDSGGRVLPEIHVQSSNFYQLSYCCPIYARS
jgi:hypothetical protein